MKETSGTRPLRMGRKGSLMLTLLTALLLLAGCGSSGGAFVATGGVPNTGPGPTGSGDDGALNSSSSDVTLNFQLAQAQGIVPLTVTDFRFTGFNGSGGIVFGPVTRGKAAEVTLQNVPTSTTLLQIEYLEGALVIGESEVPLSLTGGEDEEIDVNNITPVTLEKITVSPSSATVIEGQSRQFSATGEFSNGALENISVEVDWTLGTQGIATVSDTGNATGMTGGQTTVIASIGDVSGEANLTVSADNPLDRVEVTAPRSTLGEGLTLQLKAEAVLEDGTRTDVTGDAAWASSNDSVASVEPNTGLVTGEAAGGPVTITATFQDEPGTTQITVVALTLQSLEIAPASETTIVGLTKEFTATGTFTDGTETMDLDITDQVDWESSDENVATIEDGTGIATAVSPGGPVQITASFDTGTTVIDEDAPAELTVIEETIESIAVTPVNIETPTAPLGFNIDFRAEATFTNGTTADVSGDATWTSSDPTVAFVDTEDLYFTESPGETVVLARVNGVNSAPVTLKVINSRLVGLDITPGTQMVFSGGHVQYEAEATFQDLNGGADLTVDVTRDLSSFTNYSEWSYDSPVDNSILLYVQDGFVQVDPSTPITSSEELTIRATYNPPYSGGYNQYPMPPAEETATLMLDPRVVTGIEIQGIGATDDTTLGVVPAGYGRAYQAVVTFEGEDPVPLPAELAGAWSLNNDGGAAFLGTPGSYTGWYAINHSGSTGETATLSLDLGGTVEELALSSDDSFSLQSLSADFGLMPTHRILPVSGIRAIEVIGTFNDGANDLVFAMPYSSVTATGTNVSYLSLDSIIPAIQGNAAQASQDVVVSSALSDGSTPGAVEGVEILQSTNLRLNPDTATIQVGQDQQFAVLIDYTGGDSDVDVTPLVIFYLTGDPLVMLDASGLVTGLGVGSTGIGALYPGLSAVGASVEVTP